MQKNVKIYLAGYTLVEVLVTSIIIAILTIAAVAAYQPFIYNSAMKAAAQVLLKNAQYMEKYYAFNGRYTAGKGWPSLPYNASPESGKQLYLISLSPSHYIPFNDNNYRLIATPICGTIAAKNNSCDCINLNSPNTLVVGTNHSCYICADQDNNLTCSTNVSCSNASGTPC